MFAPTSLHYSHCSPQCLQRVQNNKVVLLVFGSTARKMDGRHVGAGPSSMPGMCQDLSAPALRPPQQARAKSLGTLSDHNSTRSLVLDRVDANDWLQSSRDLQ